MQFHGDIVSVLVLSLVCMVAAIPSGSAECDICPPKSLVACHTQNTFSICVDGYPSHDYLNCPPNHVCSSASAAICVPEETAVASCTPSTDQTRCAICNGPNQVFACLDERTVALCLGAAQPSELAISVCPDNTVCDLNNPRQFCTDIANGRASCAADLSDANLLCSFIATVDGFYSNIIDRTCKTYVYCARSQSGVWTGTKGSCTHYYDAASKLCVATAPEKCAQVK